MKTCLAIILGTVMAWSAAMVYGVEPGTMPAAEKKAAMAQSVYVCPDCHIMAMKEGKCSMCGKEMTKTHILGVKNGEAMVCSCEAGCKCDAAGMKDGKCACGKDVGKVSMKGLYDCPAGCPVVSDKAGKCPGCGKPMKKVE